MMSGKGESSRPKKQSFNKSLNKSVDETHVDQLRDILHSVSAHLSHEQQHIAQKALDEVQETLLLANELILNAENMDKSHINSLEKQLNHVRLDRDKQTAALRATVNQHAKDNGVLRATALQLRKEAEEAISKQVGLEKMLVASQVRVEVLENDLQQATQQIFQSQKQIQKVVEMERKDINKNSKYNCHERLLLKGELDAVRAELHKERQHHISEKLAMENAVQHANSTVTVVEQHIIDLKEQLRWEKSQREEIEKQYQTYYMENMHHQGHVNMKIQTDAKRATLDAAHTVELLTADKAALEKDASHLGELVDSLAAKCVLYVDNLNLLRGKMVDMQYEIESAHNIMAQEGATQPQCVEQKEQVLSMEAAAALDMHFSKLKGELQELIVENDALFDDFNTNADPSHHKEYTFNRLSAGGNVLASPIDLPTDGKSGATGSPTAAGSSPPASVGADRDRTRSTRIGSGTGPGVYVSVETGGTDAESTSPFSPAAARNSPSRFAPSGVGVSGDGEVVIDADSPSPSLGQDVQYSARYPYLAEEGMAGVIASTRVINTGRPPRSNSPPRRSTRERGYSHSQGDGDLGQSFDSGVNVNLSINTGTSSGGLGSPGAIPGRRKQSHFSGSPYALQRSSSPLRASFSPTEFGASINSTSSLNRDTNVTVSSPKDYIIVKESMSLLDKRYQDELYVNQSKISALEEEVSARKEEIAGLQSDAEMKSQAHSDQLESLVRDYEEKCSGLYDKVVHYQQVADVLEEKQRKRQERRERELEERGASVASIGSQMDASFLSDCGIETDTQQLLPAGEGGSLRVTTDVNQQQQHEEGLGLGMPTQQLNSPTLALKSQLEQDYIRDINHTNNMLTSMESRLQMLLNENSMLRKLQQEQKLQLEEHEEQERARQLSAQGQGGWPDQSLMEPDSMAVLVGDEGDQVLQGGTHGAGGSAEVGTGTLSLSSGGLNFSPQPTSSEVRRYQYQSQQNQNLGQSHRECSAQTPFRGSVDAESSTAELEQDWHVLTHNTDTNTDTRVIMLDNATVSALLHSKLPNSAGGASDTCDTTVIVSRLQEILSESLEGKRDLHAVLSPSDKHTHSPYTTPIGSQARGEFPADHHAVVHVAAADLMLLLNKLYLTRIQDHGGSGNSTHGDNSAAGKSAGHSETEAELRMEVTALLALNEELNVKLAAMERTYEETKKEMGFVVRTLSDGVSGHVSATKHRSPGAGMLTENGGGLTSSPFGGKAPETPMAAGGGPVGSAANSVTGSPPSLLEADISSLQDHLQQLMTGKDNILSLVEDYKDLQHRYNMLDTKYNVLSTQMANIPPNILVAAAEKRVVENKLQHTVDICNARIKAHISRSEREKCEFSNILRSEAEKARTQSAKLKENTRTIHQLTVQLKAYQMKEYSRDTVGRGNSDSSSGNSAGAASASPTGYQANLGAYYASEAASQSFAQPRPAMAAPDEVFKLPPWLETDPNTYTRHDEILHLPDRVISRFQSEQRLLSKSTEGRLQESPSLFAPTPVPVPVPVPVVPPEEEKSGRATPTSLVATEWHGESLNSPVASSGLSFMKTAHAAPAPTSTDNVRTAAGEDSRRVAPNTEFQAAFGGVLRRVVLRHGFDKMKEVGASGIPVDAAVAAREGEGVEVVGTAVSLSNPGTPNQLVRTTQLPTSDYDFALTGQQLQLKEAPEGGLPASSALVINNKAFLAPNMDESSAPDTEPRTNRFHSATTDCCEQTYLV